MEGLSAEVLLVDNLANADFDASVGPLGCPVRIERNRVPKGLAANVNSAARAARGRFLLLLNPDTAFRAGRLREAIAFMEREPVAGVVGCKLVNSDGTVQRSCRRFPTVPVVVARSLGADRWPWRPGFYRHRLMEDERLDGIVRVDWVFGAFMLVSRAAFAELGGLDERFYLYYEDVDLCYRLRRRGLETFYFPGIEVLHHWQRDSAGLPLGSNWRRHVRSMCRFFWKHGYLFQPEPECPVC